MKKMMIALVAMLTMAATGKAMSYEQARNEALFLTDKMAYELNLTDDQYEAAYEINLDYLMGVTSYDDVFGTYWERRNLDMSYILFDWQWNAFCAASYFYRPLYWRDGYWHFGIYARYPHRDYFYFGRPVFYASYRGGHAWHHVGGRGYYYDRRDHFRPTGRSHFGMLDRWNRGDYRGNHPGGHGNGHFGGNRNSSTRTTAGHGHRDNRDFDRPGGRGNDRGGHGNDCGNGRGMDNNRGNGHNSGSGSFGGHRDRNSFREGVNDRHSTPSTSSPNSFRDNNHSSSSFGGSRSSEGSSFSGSRSSEGSSFKGSSHSSGSSFSGSRSSSGGSSFKGSSHSSGSSFSGSRSSGGGSSFKGSSHSSGSSIGSSRSGGSFGGGSHSGGGSKGGGGGRSFGGHR